jgi:C1A family cysteine protease
MKMLKTILFIALFAAIFTLETESDIVTKILDSFQGKSVKDLFKAWHLLFKKNYELDTMEAKSRFRIFKDNLNFINENNAKNSDLTLGLNQFSDLTIEEFRKLYTDNTLLEKIQEMEKKQLIDIVDAQEEMINSGTWQPVQKDNKGAYSPFNHSSFFLPARNQGSCGSCWAFATVCAIEGNRAILNGKKVYLSPQQLVDCDLRNNGCNGGWLDASFAYIVKSGIAAETSYAYKAVRKTCDAASVAKVESRISGIKSCNPSTCANGDLFYSLLKQGPVSVVVDAGTREFQSYKSGILSGPCKNVNHAITAVGYNVTGGVEHWIVRNSWAESWGMKGYANIKRDAANKSCFIDQYAWLPTVTQ